MNDADRLFGQSRGYRALEVWRLGMDAVESVYAVTRRFPRDERYSLTNQLRRAAISIPSNIAEGNERRTSPDQLRFVGHARGSLAELETQLEIGYRLGYADFAELTPTVELLDHLGRKLTRFHQSVLRRAEL